MNAAAVNRGMTALSALAVLACLGVLVFAGAPAISFRLIPIANYASAVALALSLLLLPVALWRPARKLVAIGYVVATHVLAVTVWLYGLLITGWMLGNSGLVAGLAFGLVGVVPLGLAAAALKGLWFLVLELAFGIVLTAATWILSRRLRPAAQGAA